jgi:hypothetical protein
MNIIDRIKYWWWGSMELWEDLASIFIPAAFIIAVAICSNSCSTIKEIPVQTVEKIEYRDSIVYVTDSVLVEVPVEKIVQVLPQDTISILSTSVALSEAKIDKGMLHHSLEQKGAFLTQIDTFYITQIKEVEKLVEVPIEVVKEVKHIPNWCWWSLIYSIVLTLLIGLRIYLK